MPEDTVPTTHRSHADLVQDQLDAIAAWHAARRASESATESVTMTREMRLDLSRRIEARRREQAALVARADHHLRESTQVVCASEPFRAVIAHRSAWLRDKVAARLTQSGVVVVGSFDDGADASGAMVVEQAELLLVEDRLPTLPGLAVVRRVRAFSPRTIIGAHVVDSGGVPRFADAGAQAVFTRRVPPADIAAELVACLSSAGRARTHV